MRKCVKVVTALCTVLLTTGCWDRVEIEDRGFVVGMAVDVLEEQEDTTWEETEKPKGKQRYALTLQMVRPAAIGTGGKRGGSASKAYQNITGKGDTLFEINREFATRTSRTPFYSHIKLIVISSKIARSGQFANVLDFTLRDHEMRRGTKLLISQGKAKDILEIEPKVEKLPAMHIDSITGNIQKSGRLLPGIRIGDVHQQLLTEQSFVLQRVMVKDKGVKVAGAAVFRGIVNKMVGWLDDEETEGLNFLTGKIKGGMLKGQLEDNLVSYEIKGAKSKITADIKNKNNIEFTIEVSTEGILPETMETEDWLKSHTIKKASKVLEKELERMCMNTIEKLHKELKVDALGLGDYLYQNYPKLWKEIKNDWDKGENYFAKTTIKLKTKVVVRNTGVINQSEQIQD